MLPTKYSTTKPGRSPALRRCTSDTSSSWSEKKRSIAGGLTWRKSWSDYRANQPARSKGLHDHYATSGNVQYSTEIELADLVSEDLPRSDPGHRPPVQAAWGACEVIFGLRRSIVVWFADRGYLAPGCDTQPAPERERADALFLSRRDGLHGRGPDLSRTADLRTRGRQRVG